MSTFHTNHCSCYGDLLVARNERTVEIDRDSLAYALRKLLHRTDHHKHLDNASFDMGDFLDGRFVSLHEIADALIEALKTVCNCDGPSDDHHVEGCAWIKPGDTVSER